MIGISIAEGGFELVCGDPIGGRRYLEGDTVAALEAFAKRYGELLAVREPAAGLLALGRDLYRFLDGDGGDLARLLDRATRPVRFEIAAPTRRPDHATQTVLAGAEAEERAALLDRARAVARGNPGLQDLIGARLVLSPAVTPERAGQVVDGMQAWLAQGGLPSDPEVRQFLENLAIDTLLDLAGAAGRALLRDLTLFGLPVPAAAMAALEARAGADVRRLRDLGLVDAIEDLVDHRRTAIAVNPLAAGRVAPLDEAERVDVARAAAHDLFRAWGGAGGSDDRLVACDLLLTQLGLMAEYGAVVAACAPAAIAALREGNAAEAAALGQAAIALLDACDQAAPLRLLSDTAGAALTIGDGDTGDALLARGVVALRAIEVAGAVPDPLAATFLLYEQALRLVTRGDLDGALRILREDLLPTFERLGDVRSRAVTQGKIADILFSRGDLDGALKLQE